MAQAEKEQNQSRKNPIIWVSIIVIGLIIFIFLGSDRGTNKTEKILLKPEPQPETISEPEPITKPQQQQQINRQSQASPGLRARDFIDQIRQQGKPLPFDKMMAQASVYSNEGSLADAHLVLFFAAREGHIEAMMMMAEMSDPSLFQAENNLLDKADAIQAYKWYALAKDNGFEPAESRLENLHQWARAEAAFGDTSAQQLLLNFK